MKFSYHRDCRGKPTKVFNDKTTRTEYWSGGRQINLGYHWITADLEFDEIFELISWGGYAIAPALKSDHRCEANFLSHELALIDIDQGMTIDQLKTMDFYLKYGTGFYTTPSHTDKDQRFRIIYRLPCAMTTAEDMRVIYQGLLAIHNSADTTCRDSARLFYGTEQAAQREITDRLLDYKGIEAICRAYDAIPKIQPSTRTDTSFDPATAQEVEELLTILRKYYADLNYELRRTVTWAVYPSLGRDQTIAVMRSLWPDWDKTGRYEMLIDSHKRNAIGIGTIVALIRRHDTGFRKRNQIGNETIMLARKMLEKIK